MSKDQRYLQANEAGQAAEIATVKAVTGQHVDHFAEVNLAGFYELAQAFGGIEACVKPWDGGKNLHDANSGADLKVGYQHLGAAQALAFVRERDNLPNGDLDRTHRQQAVIDYVIWKLEHQGVLTSFSQLTNLLDIAKRYVITDSDWQILDFASEMHALTGKNLTFQTLPIAGYQTFYLGGTSRGRERDRYTRDSGRGEAGVHRARHVVERQEVEAGEDGDLSAVRDDGGCLQRRLHGQAGQQRLGRTGGGRVRAGPGRQHHRQATTVVSYGSGVAAKANAARIAALFGVTAQAGSSVTAGHVKVVLGASATLPSFSSLSSGSSADSPTSSSSSSPSSSPSTSAANNGAAGGVVSVGSNARYGIPCVY